MAEKPGSPIRRPSKRLRGQPFKPTLPENRLEDVEIEDVEDLETETGNQDLQVGPDASAGTGRVGKHSTADLAKMMAGIPAKSDWSEMRRSGLDAVIEKCAEHWGQVALFFTLVDIFCFLYSSLLTRTGFIGWKVFIRSLPHRF